MFSGIDPKKMQAMMKQLGMAQQEIDTEKVEIYKTDGKKIIIKPASVSKISMQGQVTFQVIGETREENTEKFSENDIETVIEKTGCSKKDAIKTLEETGDLAEAILKLSE